MLTRSMFVVEQVQASLFLADAAVFSSARAIGAMLGKYADRFNGQLLSMPLANDDSPEFPRVILQSTDAAWRVQFSPNRMDAVQTTVAGAEAIALSDTVTACSEVVTHYMGETSSPINRLALMITRRCPVERPSEWLVERFCNDASRQEPLNHSATFELHNHKVYTPPSEYDFCFNSWVRCKSATHKSVGSVVLVVQDLNTVLADSEERLYGVEQAMAFFALARTEADVIFDKYFPDTIGL